MKIKRIIIFLLTVFLLYGCSGANVDSVKNVADTIFKNNGFKTTGYLGYKLGIGLPYINYGGAYVYYRLEKIPDNGIIYRGAIQRWGNEYHVYDIKAYDAIKP